MQCYAHHCIAIYLSQNQLLCTSIASWVKWSAYAYGFRSSMLVESWVRRTEGWFVFTLKMTTTKVVETSVNINNNSPSQDSTNLDDLHVMILLGSNHLLYGLLMLIDKIWIAEYVRINVHYFTSFTGKSLLYFFNYLFYWQLSS